MDEWAGEWSYDKDWPWGEKVQAEVCVCCGGAVQGG